MLLIANGLIWSFPGIKILLGGIDAVRECGKPVAILLALPVFIAFHFMFRSIVRKNVSRVGAMPDERVAFWKMMPLKSWLILLFMMSLGITLKLTGIASVFFIAFFYCGLGAALSEAALTYIIKGICRLIR